MRRSKGDSVKAEKKGREKDCDEVSGRGEGRDREIKRERADCKTETNQCNDNGKRKQKYN